MDLSWQRRQGPSRQEDKLEIGETNLEVLVGGQAIFFAEIMRQVPYIVNLYFSDILTATQQRRGVKRTLILGLKPGLREKKSELHPQTGKLIQHKPGWRKATDFTEYSVRRVVNSLANPVDN